MSKVNEVTIDRAGRVSIPKEIRTRLGLSPGTKLSVEAYDGEEVRLRLVHDEPILVNKDGVLVVQSQAVGDLDAVERRERESRLDDLTKRAGF